MFKVSSFLYFILTALFSLVLANFGALVIRDFPEKPYLGIAIIVLAFLLIFFADAIFRIKDNTKQIKEIVDKVENIDRNLELDEKLYNTVKDIVLTRKFK